VPSPERLQLVSFRVDELRHAVALSTVERVLHAVEVTPLPGAPPVLLGVMDLAGEIVPVFSLSPRLQRPARPPRADDQFLLVRSARRLLAVMADAVEGVITCDATPASVHEAAPHLRGVIVLEDDEQQGLLLIHDVEVLLAPEEAQWVERHVERPA
jgi:purine-binding chemotaxis protein CheW